jgi:hypothetical protein
MAADVFVLLHLSVRFPTYTSSYAIGARSSYWKVCKESVMGSGLRYRNNIPYPVSFGRKHISRRLDVTHEVLQTRTPSPAPAQGPLSRAVNLTAL